MNNPDWTLGRSDIELAEAVADAYHEHIRFPRRKCSDRKQWQVDFEAACGEIAFSRLFQKQPSVWIPGNPEIVEPGYDCILHGWTIDVKTTPYLKGMLVANLSVLNHSHVIDFFALMVGTCPSFSFRGFAKKEYLLVSANLRRLREDQEPCFCMEQSQLKGVERARQYWTHYHALEEEIRTGR